MKKLLSRVLVAILACTLLLGLASTTMAADNVLEGKKPIKIGVMDGNWASRQGVLTQKYCDAIGKELNIEFEYYTCGFDAESSIAGVENMITSGCDGVITAVTTGINQQADVCEEMGVPLAVLHGIPKDAELERFMQYSCVASLIYVQDPPLVGADMAQAVLDLGFKNVAVIHNPTGILETQDKMVGQFVASFEEGGGTVVAEAQDMFNTQPETAETIMMNYGDQVDLVWGVLDCVLPGIQASGIEVPVVTHDLPIDDPASYFENGIIAFDMYDIPEKIGFSVVGIINWLNGDKYPDQPDFPHVVSPYTQIRTAEECELVVKITEGTDGMDPWYTGEELKEMIIAYNPEATWAQFEANAAATQVEELCARRGVEFK